MSLNKTTVRMALFVGAYSLMMGGVAAHSLYSVIKQKDLPKVLPGKVIAAQLSAQKPEYAQALLPLLQAEPINQAELTTKLGQLAQANPALGEFFEARGWHVRKFKGSVYVAERIEQPELLLP